MVDEVISSEVSQDISSTQSVAETPKAESVSSESPESTAAPISNESAKPEKLFTRDEVAKIANAEKQKAIEKARKEFETAQQLKATSGQQQQYMQHNAAEYQPQPAALTPEQIAHVQQVIAAQAQQQAQEMFIQSAATDFSAKMSDAEKRYEDYNDVVNGLELDKLPPQELKSFVALLNVADNGADILYHMGKNPSALLTVAGLAGKNPHWAIKEVHRISQSLKENESAVKAKVANPPLSQINPSTTGADNGTLTIKDYKKMFRV